MHLKEGNQSKHSIPGECLIVYRIKCCITINSASFRLQHCVTDGTKNMKKNKLTLLRLLAMCIQVFLPGKAILAQVFINNPHDSTYYVTKPELITTRFYFSQKYTAFALRAPKDAQDLKYRPNTNLNMGVGASYRNITLNVAYGFDFLNNEPEKGKTKLLDLQVHSYPKKWSIDFYGQFYKGYYLSPRGFAANSPASFYLRPDAGVHLFGLAVYYVFNPNKFSYRAATLQTEWQKKSAGSFLFGGEAHYGMIKSDSSMVPGNLEANYPQEGINNVRFFSFGPGFGYAYTLVMQQHYFITGSLSLNLNLGFSTETDRVHINNNVYTVPISTYRFSGGYNSSNWHISATWTGNSLPVQGASSPNNYLLQTGMVQLKFGKKIMPGQRLKKRLSFLDRTAN